MNILFLGHQWRNYGTYWRMLFLARGLVKLGHRVTVATVSRTSRFHPIVSQLDGVTVWEGPNLLHDLPGQGTGPLDIWGRWRLLQAGSWDVVHGFESFANIRLPLAFSGAYHRCLVVSDWCDWYSHGGLGPTWSQYPWVQRLVSWQEDSIRKKVHAVTVISQGLKQRTESLGVPPERIFCLPGGAPVDLVQPGDQASARQRWQLPRQSKVVAFIGSNQGDMDLLLDAFAWVAKRLPESRLLLAGPKNAAVAAQAAALGLSERIHETGYFAYEDLSSILTCADVCALPLRDSEANRTRWPQKIGEYMAAGKPTVTQPVGEMKMLFGKYAIGRTALAEPEAFGGALAAFLQNPDEARVCGREARQVAEHVLAWDVLAGQLAECYQRWRVR